MHVRLGGSHVGSGMFDHAGDGCLAPRWGTALRLGGDVARLAVQAALAVSGEEPVVDRGAVRYAGRRRHLHRVKQLLRVLPNLASMGAKREPQADQVRL